MLLVHSSLLPWLENPTVLWERQYVQPKYFYFYSLSCPWILQSHQVLASETWVVMCMDVWKGSYLGHSFIHSFSFIHALIQKIALGYLLWSSLWPRRLWKKIETWPLPHGLMGKANKTQQAIMLWCSEGPTGVSMGCRTKRRGLDPGRSQRRFSWVGDRRWTGTNQLERADTPSRRTSISDGFYYTSGSSLFSLGLPLFSLQNH